MGLTIHYELKSDAPSPDQARQLVSQLRSRALDLPFGRVDDLVELKGEACSFENCERDDPHRWLLVQASQHVEARETSYMVPPNHVIAFSTWPGEGCEQANFGLC